MARVTARGRYDRRVRWSLATVVAVAAITSAIAWWQNNSETLRAEAARVSAEQLSEDAQATARRAGQRLQQPPAMPDSDRVRAFGTSSFREPDIDHATYLEDQVAGPEPAEPPPTRAAPKLAKPALSAVRGGFVDENSEMLGALKTRTGRKASW